MERHADKDSYAGICDDIKVGISDFLSAKSYSYIKAQSTGKLPIRGTTLTLSGLSLKGSILLPIKKDEEHVLRVKKDSANRNKSLAAARQGDEDAIETLTLEDMDMYTTYHLPGRYRRTIFSVWWTPILCLTVWSATSTPYWERLQSFAW